MSPLSRRDALKIGGVAAGAAILPRQRSVHAQEVTITFWNGTFGVEDPNDKTKPKEEFYIYQAIERFQTANPGIKVEIEDLPTDTTMFTKFRTAGVAKNGPDVMSLWSGTYMLNLKDFILPLGPHFTPEERARITGWEAVTLDFNPESPDIYGVPNGTDGTTAFFYNNALMAAAGVDPATAWPTDFASFIAVLDQIKASGATPMVLENYGYVLHILMYWIAQTIGGSSGIGQLARGERKFDDPALVPIVQAWQQLAAYTAEGATTMQGSEAEQLFYTDEAVMMTSGVWILGNARPALGDNLGMVKVPDFSAEAPITHGGIGGPGTAYIVSNYSAHPDEAVAFIKFMMSAEEQIEKAKSGQSSLINVTDVDAAAYYSDPLRKQQQEWGNEPSTIFWPDNTFHADLTLEIFAQAQLAWTSDLSPEEFLQKLDAKRDELL